MLRKTAAGEIELAPALPVFSLRGIGEVYFQNFGYSNLIRNYLEFASNLNRITPLVLRLFVVSPVSTIYQDQATQPCHPS